ncbi:phospholipid carrier-dependent glycosyltransferase [Thalassotalea loyana]|uniref:Phospholipid carrier-dependent glycosyltransferase n=1 Tax=Thalassotalea loyana TaxID=280483 RepID=A0ABQ6HCY1_9GAMM|nr:glycosyltransferase family 39 protein [Thalassotalea loyana]GLX84595.1 phospholipid carrier-dependent glycosyltransferase [Thalassotalea loyana]
MRQVVTSTRIFIALITALILVRLLSLGMYPLFDTTESRYSDIARIMADTNNYLTPMFNETTPFWGKPPMHTWASAISFEILGVSEFSARLPHFLATLLTLALTFIFVKRFYTKEIAVITTLVLCSTLGFIVGGAMVMTDALLTLSVTLAMISFWVQFKTRSVVSGIVFFVALAFGMLIKGPVAVVIIGIALVTWSLYQNVFWRAFTSLPWLLGLMSFMAMTLPWYLMAEHATPGFLSYFLWGEHVLRFIEPGWSGDLYGTAHDEAKGTIWLFWLAMACPWSVFIILWLLKAPTQSFNQIRNIKVEELTSYLIAFSIAPMLLFTLAGNILPAYVMPGLPAFAILIALTIKNQRSLIITSVLSLVLLVSFLSYVSSGYWQKSTQAYLLQDIDVDVPVVYWQKKPFSGNFYTRGQAQVTSEISELMKLQQAQAIYIAVKQRQTKPLTSVLSSCYMVNKDTKYFLYLCQQENH